MGKKLDVVKGKTKMKHCRCKFKTLDVEMDFDKYFELLHIHYNIEKF